MRLWRRIYEERRTALLPLLIVLAANAAVLALGVFPLAQNVASLQNDERIASTNLVRARFVDKQAKDARSSKERADQELKKFYVEILPGNATGARKLVSFLEHAADDTGLVFQRSLIDDAEVKDSQLARMSGKVTLFGEYQNVRKFLYTVETAHEFVVIERVGLAQAADLRTNAGGKLEVTLDVATYYLIPSAPGGQ